MAPPPSDPPDDADRTVRIADVAAAAGVSIMSVSRAMRGVDGVSETKRREILAIARSLGYAQNRVASALAGANSTLIGVCVPTLQDAVFTEILEGMRPGLARRGFQTVIDASDYDEAREEAWVERMIAWRPAGIILSGVDHSTEARAMIRASQIPMVEIWDLSGDREADSAGAGVAIGIDHRAAGAAMAEYLLGLGYRRPAYVGVALGRDRRATRRLEGFAARFAEAGAPVIAEATDAASPSFQGGFEGAQTALRAGPDLLYCLNDHMAFGALMACEAAGKPAPEAIGVAGFNDLGINAVLPKPLTTSRTPRTEIGERAAAALINLIAGAARQPSLALPVTLIPGATTRARQ